MSQTVLITGASGYLAHRLVPIVAAQAAVVGVARDSSCIVGPASAQSLDITNRGAVDKLVDMIRPDAIIHTAACNPGTTEALMDAVNHLGTQSIALAAARVRARLVMVSTDIVHDGQQAPYSDDAQAHPINAYGASKAHGEQACLQACPDAIIARTSLIYGLTQIDRGTDSFIERLRAGQTLSLFTDVIRQPMWVDSLAQALCDLALARQSEAGVINLVGEQAMSRADFGLAMLRHWNQTVPENKLRLTQAGDTPGIPLDCTMRVDRAKSLGYSLPGVAQVLIEST